MRVLIVGASGAIGTRLIRQLVEVGHEVVGTHVSPQRAETILSMGGHPERLDLLDARAVRRLVSAVAPDVVVHQATSLGNVKFSRNLDKTFAATNRLRAEGTDQLLEAAADSGVKRVVAQSFANYRYARTGSSVKSEDDALDPTPAPHTRGTNAAMDHVDHVVTAVGGVVLRYGAFYGAANDGLIQPVRKGQFPIVGSGEGVTSFVHLEDAASATVLALDYPQYAIFNIVDDDPAPVNEWLPVLADALGAKPPRKAPRWLGRLFAGPAAVVNSTEARGASNALAKRELGWTLRYPSWRQGFKAAYADLDGEAAASPRGSTT